MNSPRSPRAGERVDLALLPELLHGHVGLRRRGAAIQLLRIPEDEFSLCSPRVRTTGQMTAGIRLRMQTDSRVLRLAVLQREFILARASATRPAYQLLIDGQLASTAPADGGAIIMRSA